MKFFECGYIKPAGSISSFGKDAPIPESISTLQSLLRYASFVSFSS